VSVNCRRHRSPREDPRAEGADLPDDRALRVAVIVIGHIMWLSGAALRILRGHRAHSIRSQAPLLVQYYPPLVWIPLLVSVLVPHERLELDDAFQLGGVALALASALLAAWAMWGLGRSYGIRCDLFAGHHLRTDGPFRLIRHPMYLGVIGYHVGASLALEDPALLLATALLVLPYTALRIAAEEDTLRQGFGEGYRRYAERVPQLLPWPRPSPGGASAPRPEGRSAL
jgi:protein-S-isoprenylcysteine O-methyltransferase Ste14